VDFNSIATCAVGGEAYVEGEGAFVFMKKKMTKPNQRGEQPATFTPGLTKAMVRQHAYELFRDKLPRHPLTLDDWVMAEKDLANSVEAESLMG